jgi:hypothetical protein
MGKKTISIHKFTKGFFSKKNQVFIGRGKYSGFGQANITGFIPDVPGFYSGYSGTFSKEIVWTQIPIS